MLGICPGGTGDDVLLPAACRRELKAHLVAAAARRSAARLPTLPSGFRLELIRVYSLARWWSRQLQCHWMHRAIARMLRHAGASAQAWMCVISQVTIHANDLEVGQHGLTTGDIVRCASCLHAGPADPLPTPPRSPWRAVAQAFCAARRRPPSFKRPTSILVTSAGTVPALSVMAAVQEGGVRH